ncbi:hypothetical protein XELAEV_18023413mg [Xenopus laevis]|uniref:Ferric-chelate reductase 1 n=1 Tax=Xenopus laevis TaxID=8355 RepID=A0A974HPJ3_XENLA|nr:hypothetical protein XELAEV_18023413mg [Xenopus laevis]
MEGQFLIFFSIYFATISGYPSGQISASCNSMLPIHGNSVSQTTPSPYSITVSKNTFSTGDIITVTLQSSSGSSFKGFLLEAQTVGGDQTIGYFTIRDGNTQALSCSAGAASAVSHTSSTIKTSITTSWTAPAGTGPIYFRATVLTSYSVFWSRVESEPLMALQISNTMCGTGKFCFSNPPNCSPDNSSCLFMSSVPANNGFVFEMSGLTTGYVAIAFSDDKLMGNDDIYICTRDSSGNILVQQAFSNGYVTPQARNLSTKGSIVSSYIGGVLKCSFISKMSISTQARASTAPSYYIFLGTGPSQASGQILLHTTKPLISASRIDLSSFAASAIAPVRTPPVILGHGALMLIAWMTTGTIGMLIARYMKHAANRPVIGKGLWFLLHISLMVLTIILTICAFIMVFVGVFGWSAGSGAHPILGCIVMILSFLQPFGAFLRPAPNHKRRFIFNWVHGLNALVIKILAVATIFLGLELVDISSTQWMPKVMGGFYGWEALFYIILEINARMKTKESYEDPENKIQHESVIMVVFICGNLAFLTSLLVGIGQSV